MWTHASADPFETILLRCCWSAGACCAPGDPAFQHGELFCRRLPNMKHLGAHGKYRASCLRLEVGGLVLDTKKTGLVALVLGGGMGARDGMAIKIDRLVHYGVSPTLFVAIHSGAHVTRSVMEIAYGARIRSAPYYTSNTSRTPAFPARHSGPVPHFALPHPVALSLDLQDNTCTRLSLALHVHGGIIQKRHSFDRPTITDRRLRISWLDSPPTFTTAHAGDAAGRG